MNVLEEAKKRPVMSGITLVGAAGAILLFMNIMPGLELIVSIKKAPEIAAAALEKAEDANDWIAAYIAEQKKQRELDQKLAEQAAEYQRQMLELQRQQQAPNQMYRPQAPPPAPQPIPNLPAPPQTPIRVYWEQDAYGDWFCRSSTGDWWWPDEDTGDCE